MLYSNSFTYLLTYPPSRDAIASKNVDNSIDQNKIRDLEKQIIQNPSTHNEFKLNKKLSKQILLEKARLGVLK